jgi:hypothetical protein
MGTVFDLSALDGEFERIGGDGRLREAAGLGGIWIDRLERRWPLPASAPPATARDLDDAATTLLGRRGSSSRGVAQE